MAFWRSRQRTPSELVRALRDNTTRLDSLGPASDGRRKAAEEISKTLTQMKAVLYGDGGEPIASMMRQQASGHATIL